MTASVNGTHVRSIPELSGFMFDVDGTLLLSDRSLGGYERAAGRRRDC